MPDETGRLHFISDSPGDTIGKSNDVYLVSQNDGWRPVFWKGWGDCPSGCFDSHYWRFSVGVDGCIELLGQYERLYEAKLNRSGEVGETMGHPAVATDSGNAVYVLMFTGVP